MTLLVNEMKTEADRKLSFLRFVNERENIRLKKEKGLPRPWTTDPILQQFRFCNMRRGDDRVTIWIGEWVAKWKSEDRWFACAVARWINEPNTLEQLPSRWDPKEYKKILSKMDRLGIKIFRASYIINGVPGSKKYVSVVDTVLGSLAANPPGKLPDSFQECWTLLREYPGMGSFMAGQVVADWQEFKIVRATDSKTWAPLGPGSVRGLNIIFKGDADAKKMSQDQGVIWMRELSVLLNDKLPIIGARLTLHDVQNTLCEFGKYCRGYAKQNYTPFEEKFL